MYSACGHVTTMQSWHECSGTIPDDRSAPWGFHDVTLVDMAGATEEELSTLRRQWPISLVSGMSKRQTKLELMWRDSKARFRNNPTGCCTFCGRNIVHDMARHVSSFRLDMCPASTWTWDSCGGAWCRGARSGRALHRTVLITSAQNIMWVTLSRLPVWGSGFHLELCQKRNDTRH